MMGIAEFVRARLDEDEREANVCLARWREGQGVSRQRWDRQLREVKAKRVALDWYENDDDVVMYPTIRAIAAIYADHPDFDPAWS